jgi:ABC-type oligopeptide transport system ATPase subunit
MAAASAMSDAPLVCIRGLTKRYRRRASGRGATVDALAGVDLTIERGRAVALVGESGSGKSTLARCLAGQEEPTSGEICFDGALVWSLRGAARRAFRESVQLLFQDSAAALSPRLTASEIVSEPLEILGRGDRAQRRRRALELMETVGLSPAEAERRPLELSGGQRQRLAIARALAVKPRLLILDEAFTGLDASIQAQVAALLQDLRGREGLTYLFISHDLALMSVTADEVAIMFEGRIVERAEAARLFAAPAHPHTRALVAAVPSVPPLAEAAATS